MTLKDNSADIPEGQDSLQESKPLAVTDFMELDESYSTSDSKTGTDKDKSLELNNLDIVMDDLDSASEFKFDINQNANDSTDFVLERQGDLNTADFAAQRGETTKNAVEVDGKLRPFSLHVPENYDSSNPTRLIMAYHGITSSGAQLEERSGLSERSDKENIVIAYMEGSGGKRSSWNNGQLAFSRNDDVQYSQKVLDKVSSNLNIDSEGVFAVGFSQGESMVHRLANDPEFKDKLAGIGVVGGWMTGKEKISNDAEDSNQDDLSVISIKSNADRISPAEGKFNWGFANMKPETYDESFYKQRNEIGDDSMKTEVMNPDGKLIYTESSSQDGETGARVKSIRMEDESHIWPGSKTADATVHPENDATELIIDFFNGISKKQT